MALPHREEKKMTIPQNAKDLRRALDNEKLFSLHIPGSRGCVHEIRVIDPKSSAKEILVLVEYERYTLFSEDHDENRIKSISETVEAIKKALSSRG
jgi:hypothetical protein